MDSPILCGKKLAAWVGAESPFAEVIVLDYEDGPMTGAAQCRAGTECYAFRMLAIDDSGAYDERAWDQGEEMRIFGLAPLSPEVFEHLARRLAQPGASEQLGQDDALYREVSSLLAKAQPLTFVIATHGIRTPLLAARAVTAETSADVHDWFSFLGLAMRVP